MTAIGAWDSDPPGLPRPSDLLDSTAAGPIAARGGAMRAAGYVLAMMLGILSAPLMIRHLGVEDYGRYVTVLSLVAVVAGLSEAGVAAIALREYASRSGTDRANVMRELLGIRIALTVAGVAIGVVFAFLTGYPKIILVGTVAAGGALLLQSVQTLLGSALQGELRFGWVTIVELARQALFVATIAGLVIAGAGLETFFFAQIPAFALTLVVTVLIVRQIMPLRPSFHLARWWPLLRDTAAYAVAIALNAAYFRAAMIALSLLSTERETGYFATSLRVVEVLIAIPALLFGAAFPILARSARDDHDRLDTTATRLIEIALILGVWIALGVLLAASPIITLLAGNQSEPSVDLLRIQAVALVATVIAVAAGFVLLALRRHRAILLANAAALVVALTITPVLISLYDATGAAVGVLLAEATLGAVTLAVLLRTRPRAAASLRRLPRILLSAVIAGLSVLVPGLPTLGDVILGVLAFPLLLAAIGCFPPEVADALRGLRRTRAPH